MALVDQLAIRLSAAHQDKGGRGKAVSIHLFGIEYADALVDVSLDELTRKAAVPQSYRTEIRKGMNLARYVMLRG